MSTAQELLNQVDQMMRRNRAAEAAGKPASEMESAAPEPEFPVPPEPALTVREPEVPVLTEPVMTAEETAIPILTQPVPIDPASDIPVLTEQVPTVRETGIPVLTETVPTVLASGAASEEVPVLTEAIVGFGATAVPTVDPIPASTTAATVRPANPQERAAPLLQPTSAIDDARWRELADEVRDDVLKGLGLAAATGPFAEIDARAQRIADRIAAEVGVLLHTEIERLLRERIADAVARAVAEARRRS